MLNTKIWVLNENEFIVKRSQKVAALQLEGVLQLGGMRYYNTQADMFYKVTR